MLDYIEHVFVFLVLATIFAVTAVAGWDSWKESHQHPALRSTPATITSSCHSLVMSWHLEGASQWTGVNCAEGDSLVVYLGVERK